MFNNEPAPYVYISTSSQHQLVILIISLIIMAFAVLFFIPWSLKMFNQARLYSIRAKELSSSDIPPGFPYVLYLHSSDTQLKTSLLSENSSQTEEEIIVHSLSPIGKTVAIGCSANSIPPLGGCYINVSDEEWQNTVMQLSKDAELTAIRIKDTENLGWEIKYAIMNISDLQKLIFLIPDIEKTNLAFFARLEETILNCRPDDVQTSSCFFNKQGWGTVSSIIYFEKQDNNTDKKTTYTMKQSPIPRRRIWNRFGNLSSAFQKALFPVYKHFGKLRFTKRICNFLSTYNFYILTAIIICSFYLNWNLYLEQWFQQPFTTSSADYSEAIHNAEQRYPKLANMLAQRAHERQRGYMLENGHLGCKYLSDQDLIEFVGLDLQVYNNLFNRKSDICGMDFAIAQLPKEDAIKYNNYIIKSVLMVLKLDDPEYTSITTPEEFQNELMEARSSLTKEQNETVDKFLSSYSDYSKKQFYEYIDFISKLPDDSVKALLFRGGYIMRFKDIEQ